MQHLSLFAICLSVLFCSCSNDDKKLINTLELVYVNCNDSVKRELFNNDSSDLKPFYIGRYEVSQADWIKVMNHNPSSFGNDSENRPVERVSWFACIEFCNILSRLDSLQPCYKIDGTNITYLKESNGYRLPTEDEWLYAASLSNNGSKYLYSGSCDFDLVSWCLENSNLETHEVGTKKPNPLGLYDMSGNVWEWCWDLYDASKCEQSCKNVCHNHKFGDRVLRGGCWFSKSQDCYVTSRGASNPFNRYLSNGFRIARNAN